jgi:CDP-diacylglycerol--glycerol-3-phosphate 3-phosphatidyltransferase
MTIPNKITLVRILLIPFIIFFYLASGFVAGGKLIATILFAVGVFTDFLDGFLARKLGQVSTLGIFLDSIADKMLVISSLALVVADGTIASPWGVIAFVIIISREFIVSALRQLGASKNMIIPADMWGKVKAVFQFFCTLFFMLLAYFSAQSAIDVTFLKVFSVVCYCALFATTVATIISGVHYLLKNKGVFTKTNEN